MKYEVKDDTGALFKNDDKKTDNHPDYTGKIVQNGKERRIAAWIKKSQKGTKYMSLSISDFQNKTDEVRQAIPQDDPSDEIPF